MHLYIDFYFLQKKLLPNVPVTIFVPVSPAAEHHLRAAPGSAAARENTAWSDSEHEVHHVPVQEERGDPGAGVQAQGGDGLHGRHLQHLLEVAEGVVRSAAGVPRQGRENSPRGR